MQKPYNIIEEVKYIFKDLPALIKRLSAEPGVLADRAIIEDRAGPDESTISIAEGRKALQKIREGAEDLTNDEERGLEAIVARDGRPAISIAGGKFGEPPADWQKLNLHRNEIESVIQKVGRVEVSGHSECDWIGTAFLVGSQLIMTNRHVAEQFVAEREGKWIFNLG